MKKIPLRLKSMNFLILSLLIILSGCSGNSNLSGLIPVQKLSKSQLFLSDLKDSLIKEYKSVKPQIERQELLEKYHQLLQVYLYDHHLDSIRVIIDEVLVNGSTIKTKSHFSSIQFEYSLTFGGATSPRIDSIYKFMKGLKVGSDTQANFSYTGACQVNSPDSANSPVLRIYASPIPLKYVGQ